jgi:hypothetical protein
MMSERPSRLLGSFFTTDYTDYADEHSIAAQPTQPARLGLYAWIIFFASRLMQSVYNGVLWLPEVLVRDFIFAGILLGVYFYFKRKYVEKPEMMFP